MTTIWLCQNDTNVFFKIGNGYRGWKEKAPFDAIIVTAAPKTVPKELVEQLKDGGRMIMPLGDENQQLVIIQKKKGRIIQTESIPVRFVPLVEK